MTYQEIKKQLRDEAGLAFGGYNEDGEEMWIGTDQEWQAFMMMEQALEDEYNDPPEGSVFHPDYSPFNIQINQVPKL